MLTFYLPFFYQFIHIIASHLLKIIIIKRKFQRIHNYRVQKIRKIISTLIFPKQTFSTTRKVDILQKSHEKLNS